MASTEVGRTTHQTSLNSLLSAHQAMALAQNPDELLRAVLDQGLVEPVDYSSLWALVLEAEVAAGDVTLAAEFWQDGLTRPPPVQRRQLRQIFPASDPNNIQCLHASPTPYFITDLSTDLDQAAVRIFESLLPETESFRRMALLPLASGGQFIGIWLVAWRTAQPWPDSQCTAFTILGTQLASNLRILKLSQIEESERRMTQLATAAEVAQLLSSLLDPVELMERVVTTIRDRFDFYYVGLFLVEEVDGERFAVLKAGTGEAGEAQLEAGHKLRFGQDSVVGWAVAHGQARIAFDVDQDGERFGSAFLSETHSEMALPLNSRGETIGALTVQSTQRAAFSQSDISVLQTMADHVASAVENARLFAVVNESLEETNTLYTISRRIAAALTITQVAEIIVDAVPKSKFDHVILILIEATAAAESSWIQVVGAWDRFAPAHDFVGNRYSSQTMPIFTTARPNEILVEEDVVNSTQLAEPTRQTLTDLGIKSLLAVPLFAGEKLLGWLAAETTKKKRSFIENDVRALQLLADQAGISIDRLQKTESLARSREQYETMVRNVPGVVYRRSPRDNFSTLYLSEEVRALTGYEPSSLAPDGEIAFVDLVHPDDRARFVSEVSASVEGAPLYQFEYQLVDKTGTTKHVLDKGRRVYDDDGQVLYLDGIISDISQRWELQSALEQRANQLQSAAEVSSIASSILDAKTLMDHGVELIRQRFDLDYVGLFLVQEGGRWAVLQAGVGIDTLQLGQGGFRLAIDETSTVGRCIDTGRAQRTVGDQTDPVGLVTYPHSEVALPLRSRSDVIGALIVQSDREAAFDPEGIKVFQLLADQLANAIVNAHLFAETKRNFQEQTLLKEITTVASANSEQSYILTEVARQVVAHYHIEHCGIALYDGNYETITLVAEFPARGATGTVVPARGYPAGEQLIKDRVPVVINDALNSSLIGKNTDILAAMGINTVAFIPIKSENRLLGSIGFDVADPEYEFSQADLSLAEAIASQVAVAIERTRLFLQTQEALQETSALYEATRQLLSARTADDVSAAALKAIKQTGIYAAGVYLFADQDDLLWMEQHAAWSETDELLSPVGARFRIEESAVLRSLADDGLVIFQEVGSGHSLPEPFHHLLVAKQIESLAVFPLVIHENLSGLLGVAHKIGREAFTDRQVRFFQIVAQQMAVALQDLRLFQETQVALEETAALYRVSRALAQLDDEQEMYTVILIECLQRLGLQQGGVVIFDGDLVSGRLKAHVVGGELVEPGLRIPIADSPVHQQLIETRQPVVIGDVHTNQLVGPLREFTRNLGIESLLLVPIVVRGAVIGTLEADATVRPHYFSEREIALVQAVADLLSVSLEKHHLLAETRRRALQLQTGADVGRVLTANLELDVLVDETVELIRDRFQFAHAQIFLLDAEGKWAVLHKSTGSAGQELLALGHKLPVGSQSVIGQVTAQRKTVVARDVDRDQVHRPNVLLPDTRAEIAIPLQVGKRLIGALDVQSNESNAFNDDDILTLELLAAQIAVAIENARTFAEQQKTAERLRELDRMKTQFLANMSHELRTPLNSIIGFSRVILKGIDGPITDLQKTDLTAIYNSGQHLLGLINNILDLSKIEAGKMELDFEEVDLAQTTKSVMSTAIALVKDKNVALVQDLAPELPRIYADPTRVRQILLNLIANAAKFTNEGQITLRVYAEDEHVVISVRDSGVGIPHDKLEHIFEEFAQVDASTTRRAGGSGLGLPITRRFVEMHKGRISVESIKGGGSTFTVRLPVSPNQTSAAPLAERVHKPRTPSAPHRIILVVDDDEGVITLYQRYLHTQNYHIIGLRDSRKVVTRTKAVEPYTILLDILIPGKDGWTVLRELKEDPATSRIPVIVASIVSGRERALSLGAFEFLQKPIVASELIDTLEKLEASTRHEGRVLAIDDMEE